jgi:hypothetical protein
VGSEHFNKDEDAHAPRSHPIHRSRGHKPPCAGLSCVVPRRLPPFGWCEITLVSRKDGRRRNSARRPRSRAACDRALRSHAGPAANTSWPSVRPWASHCEEICSRCRGWSARPSPVPVGRFGRTTTPSSSSVSLPSTTLSGQPGSQDGPLRCPYGCQAAGRSGSAGGAVMIW